MAISGMPKGLVRREDLNLLRVEPMFTNLPILLGITVLVDYMILAILFEHLGHPLTILTALPLAGYDALVMLSFFAQELNMYVQLRGGEKVELAYFWACICSACSAHMADDHST